MEKVIISARVEYNIAEALAQIAESINAPRADVIKSAIDLYIAKYKQGPAPLTTADRQEHAALRSAVRNLMIDGQWRTLAEMAEALDLGSLQVASMHRRLRQLREVKYGGYYVDKFERSPKVWEYRLIAPPVLWKVTADHPVFARPDRFGLSESDARTYANSLRPLGYENINVTIES